MPEPSWRPSAGSRLAADDHQDDDQDDGELERADALR